jgi:hypothetical protein
MQHIKTAGDLKAAILALEERKKAEEKMLAYTMHNIIENLKPINILKNSFRNISSSPAVRTNLVKGATGIVAGLLSKKLIVGASTNLFRRLLGNAVQIGIAAITTKKAENIAAKVKGLFKGSHA